MSKTADKASTWDEVADFHRAALEIAKGRATPQRVPMYDMEVTESVGEVFVESASFRAWQERFPAGGPTGPGAFNSDPVKLKDGLRTLVNTTEPSAGALVRPDRFGLVDPGLYRPVSILQLVTHVPTATDSVEYAREASHDAAAESVPEATALTGASGRKPEGGVAFELIVERIRTFAVWVPASRNVMSDAKELRAHIDGYLAAELLREIEDQVITGDGFGENFTGVLNTVGVQTEGPPVTGESTFDALRRARTKVEVFGRTTPTAVVLNPNDNEELDLSKVNDEVNRFVGDPYSATLRPLWGMARVVSDVMPEGFALVGDFSKAVLFDREQTNILVGTADDDFIRNVIRILGESRAAFGVVRPAAFTIVTLQ